VQSMRPRRLLMAAYYRGGYLVEGMRPTGLLMAAYCRGGYLVQGMRPRGLLVAAYCRRTSSARYAAHRVVGGRILQGRIPSTGYAA